MGNSAITSPVLSSFLCCPNDLGLGALPLRGWPLSPVPTDKRPNGRPAVAWTPRSRAGGGAVWTPPRGEAQALVPGRRNLTGVALCCRRRLETVISPVMMLQVQLLLGLVSLQNQMKGVGGETRSSRTDCGVIEATIEWLCHTAKGENKELFLIKKQTNEQE